LFFAAKQKICLSSEYKLARPQPITVYCNDFLFLLRHSDKKIAIFIFMTGLVPVNISKCLKTDVLCLWNILCTYKFA